MVGGKEHRVEGRRAGSRAFAARDLGKRIFITTDIEGDSIPGAEVAKHKLGGEDYVHPDSVSGNRKHTLKLLCYDTDTGKMLWEQTAYEGKVYDNRHRKNTYASPTAVTDGKSVFAYFESMGLYSFSMDGKLLWKASAGNIASLGLGAGTSPLLAGDLIVIQSDQDLGENSFIAAFSKADGKMAWRTKRAIQFSFATPVLAGGLIVASGNEAIIAYDPKTGSEVWQTPGLNANVVNTPLVADGLVIVSTGYPTKKTLALRIAPGAKERVAWKYEKGTAYVPSPILYRGLLYLMTDTGILTCLDPQTGQPKYEGKRLPVPAKFTASPVAFDGKLFLTSEDGDTFVVKAGVEHEVLATNAIGEPVYASLAPAGNSIYLRGDKHLFRIARASH